MFTSARSSSTRRSWPTCSNPRRRATPLGDLLRRHCRLELSAAEQAPEGQLDLDGATAPIGSVTVTAALAVSHLVAPLSAALEARGLADLNRDIEVPLVRVLALMEAIGVGVDVEELRRLHAELAEQCEVLTRAIWDDAGREFNVNSTPQLRQVLFDELGLAPQKKTKTGYSTDAGASPAF